MPVSYSKLSSHPGSTDESAMPLQSNRDGVLVYCTVLLGWDLGVVFIVTTVVLKNRKKQGKLTSARASRAAKASRSAQETTWKQACSSLALALSITSKPRRLVFGGASFSAVLPGVESSSTEASHPASTKRSVPAAQPNPTDCQNPDAPRV